MSQLQHGRRATPGEPIGDPPSGHPPGFAALWRTAVDELPHLDRRDRAALADYCCARLELNAARKDVKAKGRLTPDGDMTAAYRVYLSQQRLVATLRRDLAGTPSTRERVPVPRPDDARADSGMSTLARLKAETPAAGPDRGGVRRRDTTAAGACSTLSA